MAKSGRRAVVTGPRARDGWQNEVEMQPAALKVVPTKTQSAMLDST
jgi:hypothetical protein